LSTVQVDIITIGILSGAFGENAIAEKLIRIFNEYPAIAPYSELAATVIMVLVVTFFAVVLGELVPKCLALTNPERVATLVARSMQVLSKVVHPVVALFSLASSLLPRMLGARQTDEAPVSEEEIRVMMQQGADAGVFEQSEHAMVGNIFRLDDLRVTAIMTTRLEINYLDIDDSGGKHRHIESGSLPDTSRVPGWPRPFARVARREGFSRAPAQGREVGHRRRHPCGGFRAGKHHRRPIVGDFAAPSQPSSIDR